jgi:hypothetical protein
MAAAPAARVIAFGAKQLRAGQAGRSLFQYAGRPTTIDFA